MEEAGFAEDVAVVRDLYAEGRIDEAVALVPQGLIDAFAVVGTPDEAREQLQRFRDVAVALPMLSLRTSPGLTMTRQETVDRSMR